MRVGQQVPSLGISMQAGQAGVVSNKMIQHPLSSSSLSGSGSIVVQNSNKWALNAKDIIKR